MAFNTGALSPHLSPRPEEEHLTLFIPTTPNPTSGVLTIVPRSRVRSLDLSVEDAMKLILTGGVVKPEPRLVKQQGAVNGEVLSPEAPHLARD